MLCPVTEQVSSRTRNKSWLTITAVTPFLNVSLTSAAEKKKWKKKKSNQTEVKLILLITHGSKLLHFAKRKPKLYVPGLS